MQCQCRSGLWWMDVRSAPGACRDVLLCAMCGAEIETMPHSSGLCRNSYVGPHERKLSESDKIRDSINATSEVKDNPASTYNLIGTS